MYRVETRISDYEIVRQSPYLFPSMRIQNKVWDDMVHLLNGKGEISSWHDVESCHTVVRGERQDEFPFQAWGGTE